MMVAVSLPLPPSRPLMYVAVVLSPYGSQLLSTYLYGKAMAVNRLNTAAKRVSHSGSSIMAPPIITVMQGPFCGTLVTLMLYGVICMQTFTYAWNYSTDRKAFKWLVGSLWIMETLHTAFSIHFVEYYLVLNYDNPSSLAYASWQVLSPFCVRLTLTTSWATGLWGFFVWRIWQVSKQIWISGFLVFLTKVHVGQATCLLRVVTHFAHKPTMIAGWTLAAFADTLIAITLCYWLRKQRSGMKRTEHVINRLLLYTINTGVLTSLFAILVITLYLALPTSMAFTAFVQVQSKLYAISLLASLNSRKATLENARRAVPTANNVSLQFLANSGNKVKRMPRMEITKSVEIMDINGDEESLQGRTLA
ncbi:hypothetical protein PAXINDRAFT_114156 [Paxillus involutus ATCC 200175]|uniref:DUF6534 domain-containing protein n=1 Tax=Paxillus involutus ATCC 200175 TaxID=664439 RepID=A0A0C9TZF1_PAXIN|nr:hypothetical protein PAXINDRAFT_114156 [Paxillus involutus ATCC 200175]